MPGSYTYRPPPPTPQTTPRVDTATLPRAQTLSASTGPTAALPRTSKIVRIGTLAQSCAKVAGVAVFRIAVLVTVAVFAGIRTFLNTLSATAVTTVATLTRQTRKITAAIASTTVSIARAIVSSRTAIASTTAFRVLFVGKFVQAATAALTATLTGVRSLASSVQEFFAERWIQKPPLGVQIDWTHQRAHGMVGCWHFKENSAKAPLNLASRDRSGAVTGVPVFSKDDGGVLGFSDTDYITVVDGNLFNFTTGKFAIGVDFIPKTDTPAHVVLVEKGEYPNKGWILETGTFDHGGGIYSIDLEVNHGGTADIASAQAYQMRKMNRCIISCDGALMTWTVNGSQSFAYDYPRTMTPPNSDTENMLIGRHSLDGYGNPAYVISRITLWNRPLSAVEAIAHTTDGTAYEYMDPQWIYGVVSAASQAFSQTLSAAQAQAAFLVKQVGKFLTGSEPTTAVLTKQPGKLLTTSTTPLAFIRFAVSVTRVTTTATSAALVRSVGKLLAAIEACTATLTRSRPQTLTATAQATVATVTKAVSVTRAVATSTSALVVKQARITLAALESTAAAVVKLVGKLLPTIATCTGVLVGLKARFNTLATSVAQTATLVKQVRPFLVLSTATVASVRFAVSKFMLVSEATALTLSRLRPITLTAAVTTGATMAKAVGRACVAAVSSGIATTKAIGKVLLAGVTTTASLTLTTASQLVTFTAAVSVSATLSLIATIVPVIISVFGGGSPPRRWRNKRKLPPGDPTAPELDPNKPAVARVSITDWLRRLRDDDDDLFGGGGL